MASSRAICISILVSSLCGTPAAQAVFTPTRLRVEYLDNPVGIDEAIPRFSWALLHPQRGQFQTAYHIVVTLTASQQVVWDSGVVPSNRTLNIEYAGSALTSDTDYVWTVQSLDAAGASSQIARGTFSTALLSPSDWAGAQWIAPGEGNLLRAEFDVGNAAVTRARLYIAGVGYYKSYINGQATDAHALGPFTSFQIRTTYDAWDVTTLVLPGGCNMFSVALGRGWYTLLGLGPRQLQAMLSVTTADGITTYYVTAAPNASVPTPSTRTAVMMNFTSAQGPVVADDIYHGETYDARLVQNGWQTCSFSNASAWVPAVAASQSPASYNATLSARTVQITVDQDFGPASIDQPSPGSWVIDFGQNMAGYATLRVLCDAGTTILMQYGEILFPNGSVHDNYKPAAMMQGVYICAGTGEYEYYTTQFSYYGFRYVQLFGFPGVPDEETLTAHFVHTANAEIGDISTGSPLLNAIQHATRYAALSNQMDVPTDCPQRERRGWMGDGQLSCETVIHNFDAAAFYTKWIRDMNDSQQLGDGALPDCVPFYGHGHKDSDPGWGIAGFNVLAWAADYYADTRLVQRYYGMARTYIEFWITNHVNNSLMVFCDWGDWDPVPQTPGYCSSPEYGSFFYITALDHMVNFAATLNNSADFQRYSQLSAQARVAYKATYYNASNGQFGSGTVLEQVFGLTLGLASPADEPLAVARMISGIGSHIVGGIVTTKLLYPLLDKYGYTNLGVALNLNTDFPSYGYWLSLGATTLWEEWQLTNTSGQASYNHIMYGGQGSWYYTTVAGIKRQAGAPSWTALTLAPSSTVASAGIGYASASLDTNMGLLSLSWNAPSGPYANATCAYAPENSNVTLTCYGPSGGAGPGVFTNITFASFGTPIGTCGSGFAANPTCDNNRSVAVVAAACLGKSQCTITASNDVFGYDPCPNTVKALAVVAAGPTCASVGYSLDATVPVNSRADVVVNTGSSGSAADAVITESGSVVWTNGAFVPGAAGITNATVVNGGASVSFATGSGQYSFVVL